MCIGMYKWNIVIAPYDRNMIYSDINMLTLIWALSDYNFLIPPNTDHL